MRKIALITAVAAAALGLAACSEKTQDAAGTTAESAANDVATGVDKAAAATDELGDKAANAANKAAANVEQERAEAEADLHNESVKEAKND
ncbi:hypothetical protein [Novosphingobium ginsenosidimutans]|uniref:Entericidin EcnAB n=1 Tax=Novosphingobium ginsenosidimutans TaxID=1176536 RepID=A0A5B8S113_9SPHN|nr:hypothetical protein [Novosphingobium ginsenosidimutans]QEA15219.1 hypothetical protein FRF71_03160 [Novosphingobium ginsenosidimutans]